MTAEVIPELALTLFLSVTLPLGFLIWLVAAGINNTLRKQSLMIWDIHDSVKHFRVPSDADWEREIRS